MSDRDEPAGSTSLQYGDITSSPFPAAPKGMAKSYLPKVQACHDLAGLLKRTRPTVHHQVVELEGIVTRAHKLLGEEKSKRGVADAWGNIDGAYHALLALRRSA